MISISFFSKIKVGNTNEEHRNMDHCVVNQQINGKAFFTQKFKYSTIQTSNKYRRNTG
jgi:hypothetical protein